MERPVGFDLEILFSGKIAVKVTAPGTEAWICIAISALPPSKLAKVCATNSKSVPFTVNVLDRGDIEKTLQEAHPGALSAIAALEVRFKLNNQIDEAARRAALADWLASSENLLTWRSIFNRVWHYHFGHGICDTPNDLGRKGGVPSHPELLDWLAVWFRNEAKGSTHLWSRCGRGRWCL